jgi:hypothetical protein
MDSEQTIAEIEYLERIFAVPDARPLDLSQRFGTWLVPYRNLNRMQRSTEYAKPPFGGEFKSSWTTLEELKEYSEAPLPAAGLTNIAALATMVSALIVSSDPL